MYKREMVKRSEPMQLGPDHPVVVICSDKDRPSYDQDNGALRVIQLNGDITLPEDALEKCGAVLLLSTNLTGPQKQAVIRQVSAGRGEMKRKGRSPTKFRPLMQMLAADTYADFQELLHNLTGRRPIQSGPLTLDFNPEKRAKIPAVQHNVIFAPPAEYTAPYRTVAEFLKITVKREDRLLPSLMVVDLYYKKIPRQFHYMTRGQIAAHWRRHIGIKVEATYHHGVYELVLYRMRQKLWVGLGPGQVSKKLLPFVRKYITGYEDSNKLKNVITGLVKEAYKFHPELKF